MTEKRQECVVQQCLAPVKSCEVADVVLICRTFWLVEWTERSITATKMETALYSLWPRGKKIVGLRWMALRSDWWIRWGNILTSMTHHGGILKMPKTPGGKFCSSLLSLPGPQATVFSSCVSSSSKVKLKLKCTLSLPNQMYHSILPFSWTVSSYRGCTRPYEEVMENTGCDRQRPTLHLSINAFVSSDTSWHCPSCWSSRQICTCTFSLSSALQSVPTQI